MYRKSRNDINIGSTNIAKGADLKQQLKNDSKTHNPKLCGAKNERPLQERFVMCDF
jgi:hypothetical protein